MKAAKDRSEEDYDPARREDILGRKRTRLELWEEHLKDPKCSLGKSLKLLGVSLSELTSGSQVLVASRVGCNGLQSCGREDAAKDVGRALLGRRLASLGSMGRGAFTYIIQLLECPVEVWATQRAFSSSFIRKEPVALTKAVPSNPCVSTETLKACALIGPHFLAAEGEAGSSGSQSPDLGDMWRQGCSKSPEWISSCSASEASLGCEV